MNTGLQDADNLAWKLAYVINGKANPNILNSYTTERLPSILDNMQWSLKNLYRIVNIQRKFQSQEKSHSDIQVLVQEQEAHLNKSGLDLGWVYESEIVAPSKDKKPQIPNDHYIPNTFPGARLPHFELIYQDYWISSLDLITTHFMFISQASNSNLIKSIDFKSTNTKLVLLGNYDDSKNIYRGKLPQNFGLDELSALWVRPDGHIAWKGQLDNSMDINTLTKIITNIALN